MLSTLNQIFYLKYSICRPWNLPFGIAAQLAHPPPQPPSLATPLDTFMITVLNVGLYYHLQDLDKGVLIPYYRTWAWYCVSGGCSICFMWHTRRAERLF